MPASMTQGTAPLGELDPQIYTHISEGTRSQILKDGKMGRVN